jgi:hypothetical protein
MIKQAPTADPTKGKTVVSYNHLQPKGRKKDVAGNKQKATKRWSKPPPGWTKSNVDKESGEEVHALYYGMRKAVLSLQFVGI